MTLLFMDGMYYPTDDILFKYSQTASEISLSTDTRRAGPGSVRIGTSLFPNGEVGYSLPGITANTIIIGHAFKCVGTPSSSFHNFINIFRTSGDEIRVNLLSDFSVRASRGSTTLGTSAPAVFSSGIWSYLEVKCVASATVGSIIVKINEVEIINVSGANTGAANFNRILWETFTSGVTYFQDLYVCDGLGSTNNDFLGDSRVDITRPDAPGTHTDFTPSAGANWENVDEVDIDDDTTYNKSSQIGDKDSYSMSDISLTGGQIFGIQQQSVVRKDDASIRYGKQLLRSGTTEDLSAELQFNDTYTAYQRILEEDPDTATTWGETGVNAIESGLTITA